MKSRKALLIIGLFLFVSNSDLHSQEPAVLNVQFIQRADFKVEVTYDLVGNPSKEYTVTLSLRKTGARGILPLRGKSVSGDIGQSVSPGRRMRIIWNIADDFSQGLEGDNFVFVVEASEQESGGKFPWIIVGLAAGGGAAYFIATQSSPATPAVVLPRPPDFPGQ